MEREDQLTVQIALNAMVRRIDNVHVVVTIESDIVGIVQQRRCRACIGSRTRFDRQRLIPNSVGTDRNQSLN